MNLWAQPCAQQPRRCAGGEGETLQQAIDYGLEVYGENDIVWYLNQNTGRRPHAAASYPIIQGDGTARLTAPGTATNSAAEQQTPAAA